VKNVPSKFGTVMINDLYVRPQGNLVRPEEVDAVLQFLRNNRVLQWEDEINRLVDSSSVDIDTVKQALSRNRAVVEYLSKLSGAKQSIDGLAQP
jgi:hypothetical protein